MQGAADKWRAAAPDLLQRMREVVDPLALPGSWDLSVVAPATRRSGDRGAAAPTLGPHWWVPESSFSLQPLIALVGHRSAGKSRLLPLLSQWTGLPGIDLDQRITEQTGQSVAALFAQGLFRAAERSTFASLQGPAIVATGGGFLSLHADLLRGHTAVLVPITFATYRARLLADQTRWPTRPRLRPEMSFEDEIAQVYAERERLHAVTPTVSLLELLRYTAPQ